MQSLSENYPGGRDQSRPKKRGRGEGNVRINSYNRNNNVFYVGLKKKGNKTVPM